ncbi:MAG: RNA polymerase sigma factor [Sphingobacteriales bacterium]|nr:MAG: RNA polymerase sigma factor [Sphingobacteriales bacterium]
MNQPNRKQQHFIHLLEPVKDQLWRYVKNMLRHKENAEDVYNQTILIAFEKLENLKNEAAFLYFLFGITRRIVRQHERKQRLFEVFSRKHTYVEADTSVNAEAAFDLEILYKLLDKLSLKEREAIVMFEISGFSIKEIQELQNDSHSAVKSRLSRAREKLKTAMSDKIPAEEIIVKKSTPNNLKATA